MPRLIGLAPHEKRLARGVFLFQPSFWRAFGWLCFAASWLNASHYLPWVNFQSEWMALTGLALVLAAQDRFTSLELPLPALVLSGLAVVPWLQWATGLLPFGGEAALASCYLLGFAAAICVGYGLASPSRPLPIAAGAILWVPALLSAVVGLLQWLGYSEALGTLASPSDFGDRPLGNFGQTNLLATHLLIGLVGVWHDWRRRALSPVPAVAVAVVLIAVFGLTRSRAGLLSAICLSGFLMVQLRRTPADSAGREWRVVFCVTVACLGAWAIGASVTEWLLVAQARQTELINPNGRLAIWAQCLAAVATHPWVGYGWNQTALAQVVGSQAVAGSLRVSYAHNVALDLLLWFGLPLGGVLVLAAAGWTGRRLPKATSAAGLAAGAALIPVVIHSMFEFPFAYASFLLHAGLCVGVLQGQTSSDRTRSLSLPWWLTRSMGLLGLCMAAAIASDYIKAEDEFRVIRFQNLNFAGAPPPRDPPSLMVLTQLEALLAAASTPVRPGLPPHRVELVADTARRATYFPLMVRSATVLAANGRKEEALAQFRTLHTLYGDRMYEAAFSEYRRRRQEQMPWLPELESQ